MFTLYGHSDFSANSFSPNRLASLYSDFHQRRQANPEGYAANSQAWLSALYKLTRAGQLPLSRSTTSNSHLAFASGEALLKSLSSPRFGRPQALGAVVSDAVKAGTRIPLDQFLSAEKSIYTRSWLPAPTDVLAWGLRSLGLSSGDSAGDKLIKGDLVVIAALEEVGQRIAQQLAEQQSLGVTDRIYSRSMFEQQLRTSIGSDQPLSSADFDILLRYLSRDKPVLSYTSTTVKIAPEAQHPPEPVTAQDETIANLRALIHGMTTQISTLQDRASALEADARRAIAAHQNAKAKQCLRQKRAAETTLDQRTQTLETLERTWDSIAAAADNLAIVAAMRDSGAVLKRLNAQVGGAEGVDEVMERLRAEMDVTEDVTQAVTEGSRTTVDEDEVDAELAALEEAQDAAESAERARREDEESERLAEETRKRLEGLDIPSAEPEKERVQERETAA